MNEVAPVEPHYLTSDDRKMVSYYQWIPLILMFQASMAFVPCLIWRFLNKRSGQYTSQHGFRTLPHLEIPQQTLRSVHKPAWLSYPASSGASSMNAQVSARASMAMAFVTSLVRRFLSKRLGQCSNQHDMPVCRYICCCRRHDTVWKLLEFAS